MKTVGVLNVLTQSASLWWHLSSCAAAKYELQADEYTSFVMNWYPGSGRVCPTASTLEQTIHIHLLFETFAVRNNPRECNPVRCHIQVVNVTFYHFCDCYETFPIGNGPPAESQISQLRDDIDGLESVWHFHLFSQARLISLYFDTKRYQEALALGECLEDHLFSYLYCKRNNEEVLILDSKTFVCY